MWTQLLKGLDTRSAFENRKFRTENKIVLIIKRIFMKIKERNQMLDKKCFADKGCYCMALEKKECTGCSFYQTKQEVEIGRAKAKARLLKLHPEQYKKYCR